MAGRFSWSSENDFLSRAADLFGRFPTAGQAKVTG
jgi:hypothetical protein